MKHLDLTNLAKILDDFFQGKSLAPAKNFKDEPIASEFTVEDEGNQLSVVHQPRAMYAHSSSMISNKSNKSNESGKSGSIKANIYEAPTTSKSEYG